MYIAQANSPANNSKHNNIESIVRPASIRWMVVLDVVVSVAPGELLRWPLLACPKLAVVLVGVAVARLQPEEPVTMMMRNLEDDLRQLLGKNN